uniref:transposase n=1 Tax=Streptomyces sp. WI03-5b TaxID=462946 RepID=UPI0039F4F4A6
MSARKRGADTGPSPVDRRRTGSKHHLICGGLGTPLKVITTAANVNDVTQTLALVDGIPPVADRPGRPRRRPDALFGASQASPSTAWVPRPLRPHPPVTRSMATLTTLNAPGAMACGAQGRDRYDEHSTCARGHGDHFRPNPH